MDPVDDFRVSNPPSNAPLLDALAKDFVAHNDDVKYIRSDFELGDLSAE